MTTTEVTGLLAISAACLFLAWVLHLLEKP